MLCATPGFVPFNRTLCLPCPAGWACGIDHLLGPCRPGFWSPQGAPACAPCSPACEANRSIVLRACAPTHDRLCHACPHGFLPNGTTCRIPPPAGLDAFSLLNFIMLVSELCLLAWCYRNNRSTPYHPVSQLYV